MEIEKEGVDIDVAIRDINAGKAILVDVREIDEWEEAHFARAISCPLTDLREGEFPELSEDMPVYVHCMKGRRAREGESLLHEVHSNVHALRTTFEDLCQRGLELDQGN